MKKLVIDGDRIKSREDLFASLKEQLQEEDFTGSNLDALYDVLTQSGEPIEAQICNPGALRASLGDYTDRLLRVLWDCSILENKECGEDGE